MKQEKTRCPSCFHDFKIDGQIKSVVDNSVICPNCRRRINTKNKICKRVYTKLVKTVRSTTKIPKITGYLWGRVNYIRSLNNDSFVVDKYTPYCNDNLKLNNNMFLPKATKI